MTDFMATKLRIAYYFLHATTASTAILMSSGTEQKPGAARAGRAASGSAATAAATPQDPAGATSGGSPPAPPPAWLETLLAQQKVALEGLMERVLRLEGVAPVAATTVAGDGFDFGDAPTTGDSGEATVDTQGARGGVPGSEGLAASPSGGTRAPAAAAGARVMARGPDGLEVSPGGNSAEALAAAILILVPKVPDFTSSSIPIKADFALLLGGRSTAMLNSSQDEGGVECVERAMRDGSPFALGFFQLLRQSSVIDALTKDGAEATADLLKVGAAACAPLFRLCNSQAREIRQILCVYATLLVAHTFDKVSMLAMCMAISGSTTVRPDPVLLLALAERAFKVDSSPYRFLLHTLTTEQQKCLGLVHGTGNDRRSKRGSRGAGYNWRTRTAQPSNKQRAEAVAQISQSTQEQPRRASSSSSLPKKKNKK